jgi:hypothetical protein
MELLLRKASISHLRSLLAQCEREAFIVQRLLAKIYHPGVLNFSQIHHQTQS